VKEDELKPIIEAALFMTNEPVSVKRLSAMFKTSPNKIRRILEELKLEFEQSDHGIYVLETEYGYQLRVKPGFVSYVRRLTPYKELGRGLLRVLSMVAYKQPITQAEIVKVIGNRTYEYVKTLEEKGLIKTVRHSRTKALMPTKEFANYFGLENPEDVKKFFEEMTKEEDQASS